jgi:hypothetical protein
MKKQKYSMSRPAEQIDPSRLAFYVMWESRYQKIANGAGTPDKNLPLWLSAIGLSLGITIITFLVAV